MVRWVPQTSREAMSRKTQGEGRRRHGCRRLSPAHGRSSRLRLVVNNQMPDRNSDEALTRRCARIAASPARTALARGAANRAQGRKICKSQGAPQTHYRNGHEVGSAKLIPASMPARCLFSRRHSGCFSPTTPIRRLAGGKIDDRRFALPLGTARRLVRWKRRQSTRDESCSLRRFRPSKTTWFSDAPGTIRTCGLCLRVARDTFTVRVGGSYAGAPDPRFTETGGRRPRSCQSALFSPSSLPVSAPVRWVEVNRRVWTPRCQGTNRVMIVVRSNPDSDVQSRTTCGHRGDWAGCPRERERSASIERLGLGIRCGQGRGRASERRVPKIKA